jgi:hypothetical protein
VRLDDLDGDYTHLVRLDASSQAQNLEVTAKQQMASTADLAQQLQQAAVAASAALQQHWQQQQLSMGYWIGWLLRLLRWKLLEDPLKQYLLIRTQSLDTWEAVKLEVREYLSAQQTARLMDLGTLTRASREQADRLGGYKPGTRGPGKGKSKGRVPDDGSSAVSSSIDALVQSAADSGASRKVIPRDISCDYPTYSNQESSRGAVFSSGSGHALPDPGTRALGYTANQSTRVIPGRVVNTEKGLLSVSERLENRNPFHFSPRGSHSVGSFGRKTPLEVKSLMVHLAGVIFIGEITEYSRLDRDTQESVWEPSSGHPSSSQ